MNFLSLYMARLTKTLIRKLAAMLAFKLNFWWRGSMPSTQFANGVAASDPLTENTVFYLIMYYSHFQGLFTKLWIKWIHWVSSCTCYGNEHLVLRMTQNPLHNTNYKKLSFCSHWILSLFSDWNIDFKIYTSCWLGILQSMFIIDFHKSTTNAHICLWKFGSLNL